MGASLWKFGRVERMEEGHVSHTGFSCKCSAGRKLAGSCQVIKIALYECHDLLTQNGNRKIVVGGEQIGIPWRTVGESFGAISHWTLSLSLSLSSSGLLSVWRHGFCDRVTGKISLIFIRPLEEQKGLVNRALKIHRGILRILIFDLGWCVKTVESRETEILFVLWNYFWIRLLEI